MRRDEIQAVYAAGPEAVIGLVEALQEQIQTLSERVKALEERLAKDSHNSHQPPSSDGPKRALHSQRQASGKKAGGQPGHEGHRLVLSERPERVVTHRPPCCSRCGADLSSVEASHSERRQVIDIPPLQLAVVEHVAQTLGCPSCGQLTRALFPPEVIQEVQYGPRLQALAVYLREYQLLPSARTRQLLCDLFGAAPCEGTLDTAVQRCAEALGEVEDKIKQALQQAAVVHFDETGVRLAGHLHWLHVASTQTLTSYCCHAKRGQKATEAIGILPHFEGRAIHDAWATYLHYACRHGLCNAHHLRELTFLFEQQKQAWAGDFKALLLEIKQAVDQARTAGATSLPSATLTTFEQRYTDLLAQGDRLNPAPDKPALPKKRGRVKQSKARNLLDRLCIYQEAVLAFMHDFTVPFDNNLAERDLRMVKVQQKISGCFRSSEGATAFCRIRSYVSTLRKQGLPILSALEHAFLGSPLIPALPA